MLEAGLIGIRQNRAQINSRSKGSTGKLRQSAALPVSEGGKGGTGFNLQQHGRLQSALLHNTDREALIKKYLF
jgi:hypothetical protein